MRGACPSTSGRPFQKGVPTCLWPRSASCYARVLGPASFRHPCSSLKLSHPQGTSSHSTVAHATGSPGSTLASLQEDLDAAIEAENYSAAARIRDELTRRRRDSRLAVEETNRRFYDAFERSSSKDMASVWGKGDHVQCIHPGCSAIAGRDNVLESWRMILRGGLWTIRLEDVRIYATDTSAFVTCIEVMDAGDSHGRSAATNIFEKQEGEWVIVHHQGGPAPVLQQPQQV